MKATARIVSLSLIGLLLVGYVIANKGFAHLGIQPVYVGEIVLGLSLALFAVAPGVNVLARSRVFWAIAALGGWCLLQTIPYIEEYGLMAPRDAVVYGYSLFAFIVASQMADQRSIEAACVLYDRVIPVCVIMLPLMIFLTPQDTSIGAEVPLVLQKAGDVGVHITGVLAFRLVGLRQSTRRTSGLGQHLVQWLFWACCLGSLLWAISTSRGAMLAVIAGMGVVAAYGFGRRQLLIFIGAISVLLMVMGLLSLRVEQERREISAPQIIDNAISVLMSGEYDDGSDLGSNTRWRLKWWENIVDYTFMGEHFWEGKGFGINLSVSDGIQFDTDSPLRSPHSAHFTFLARAGVPGLTLWMLFLATFSVALVRASARLKAAGAHNWRRVNVWLLAYWVAAVVNSSFDVYLEGPQGGIWFWCLTGMGMAALNVEARLFPQAKSGAIPR